MRTLAAVMRAFGAPLSVEEIDLDPPKAGEVQLRMVAAGICGSDRHIRDGHMPSPVPAVAGHEGSGIVEAVGPGVTELAVGDHVIQTFIGPCGRCGPCRRGMRTFCEVGMPMGGTYADGTFRMHDLDGTDIATTLRLGTFAAHTVTPVNNCVAIAPELDLVCAALVSCGVSTGVGAAVNVARVQPGDAVAVIGVGGVGLAGLVGAIIAGAGAVIAVDVNPAKHEVAKSFGATHFVNANGDDVVAELKAATGGRGVDKILLAADVIPPEQFRVAVDALAPGGIVVQIGVTGGTLDHLPIAPSALMRKQASVTATTYGGLDPTRDSLRWLELYRTGRLPLERFVTQTYPLQDINRAFDDMAAGRNIRGVVVFDAPADAGAGSAG